MKLHFYLILVLSFFVFNSCNDDENLEQNSVIELKEYISGYMFYNYETYGEKVTIDFQNQKPVKRKIPSTFGQINDGSFYEELIYNGNVLEIKNKSTNPNFQNIAEFKKHIEFNGDKVSKKIYFDGNNEITNRTEFEYSDDKITRIRYFLTDYNGGMYLKSQSEVSYSGNNVSQITTRHAKYDSATNSYILNPTDLEKDVETLSGFDNHQNPTKNLKIFDELFLRSLSENNFTQYQKIEYDENGIQTGSIEQQSWTFVYENGQINFAK